MSQLDQNSLKDQLDQQEAEQAENLAKDEDEANGPKIIDYSTINSDTIDLILQIDTFKMFASEISQMSRFFEIKLYNEDYSLVTEPSIKENIYLILKGSVVVLADQRIYLESKKSIRKKQRQRQKQQQKEPEKVIEIPESDFPFTELTKSDFKQLGQGATFGNDKILTTKAFRPCYVCSVAPETCVVSIPLRLIEEAIRKLSNTGENKQKTDFFSYFVWFNSFTQSLKTKFNNCVNKKTFYKDQYLFQEGNNQDKVWIIIEGTCSLISKKFVDKLAPLVYQQDRMKAKEDAVDKKNIASVKALTNNGYTSNTLRTVQLGLISTYDWVGDDLLIATDPSKYLHEFSAVAKTKLITYEITFNDLQKIPSKFRDQMASVARQRKNLFIQRTLQLYNSLDNIKKGIEFQQVQKSLLNADGYQFDQKNQRTQQNDEQDSKNNIKKELHLNVHRLGNEIQKMLDQTQLEQKVVTEEEIRQQKKIKAKILQEYEQVSSIPIGQSGNDEYRLQVTKVFDPIKATSERKEEIVRIRRLIPNPRDEAFQLGLKQCRSAMDVQNDSFNQNKSEQFILFNKHKQSNQIGATSIFSADKIDLKSQEIFNSRIVGLKTQDQRNQYSFKDGTTEAESRKVTSRIDKQKNEIRLGSGMTTSQPSIRTTHHGKADSIYDSVDKLNEEEKIYQLNPEHNINVTKIQQRNASSMEPSLTTAKKKRDTNYYSYLTAQSSHREQHSLDQLQTEKHIYQNKQLVISPSLKLKELIAHNSSKLSQVKIKQTSSHNVIDELLNKKIETKAFLNSAFTMKKYENPNVYENIQDSFLVKKIVPTFSSNSYGKLKNVLPQIKSSKATEVWTSTEQMKSESLVYKQMQLIQQFKDFEVQREQEKLRRKQELIKERDQMSKYSGVKAKAAIEERIQRIDDEVDAMENPFLTEVQQFIQLKPSNFSMQDLKISEKIVNQQKLKYQFDRKAEDKFYEIEMFEKSLGKRSLREVKSQNNKIQVLVKDKNKEHLVDLNTLVTDQQMNNLQIEDKLIQQLMIDDDQNQMESSYDILQNNSRTGTPNPFYQDQKRRLLLRYQKHLLQNQYKY